MHIPIRWKIAQFPCQSQGYQIAWRLSNLTLELGDMHHDTIPLEHRRVSSSPTLDSGTDNERAFPLLLGLVIHGSADGLALGVANLSNALTGTPQTLYPW